MVSTDKISDMIVNVKNAARSRKETVAFPLSKMMFAIADVLERSGFIEVVTKRSKKVVKHIEAKLIYAGGIPVFKDAKRISKPSKRIYRKIKNVASVKSGFGHYVISTPKGILTDKEAKKLNVGGEALFQIW